MIPVHGRLPLLQRTIKRLYFNNGVSHIICVGDTDEERRLCHHMGAEFLKHDNKPLGKKWNTGFLKAKESNPDAVVYVGSSDWISDNWLPVLLPLVEEHDIIGKTDFNMLHIGEETKLAHWPHYPLGSGRENESIGIGRLLSRDFLERINWTPFDDYLNMSMDFSMWKKFTNNCKGGQLLFNSVEVQSLAISCDSWDNMHKGDFDSGAVYPFRFPLLWLKMWFPDAIELIDELAG